MLSDRQQFLDLIAYLIDIGQGGPERAKQLRPAITKLIIPDYEQQIDHAALINAGTTRAIAAAKQSISAFVQTVMARLIKRLFTNVAKICESCIQNGSDPHSLYQTLTRLRLYAHQSWMVPKQKYDVIHYLRETYLKKHNPSKYAKVDERYLPACPRETTLGPDPIKVEPWVTMDYGPSLMNTYEIGAGPKHRLQGDCDSLGCGRGWSFTRHTLRCLITIPFALRQLGRVLVSLTGVHSL